MNQFFVLTEQISIPNANEVLEAWSGIKTQVINFGFNLVIALLIFFIGRMLIRITQKLINKIFIRTSMEISVRKFLHSLIGAILYVVLIIIVCSKIGIETTSLLALIGSAGLAIGLALQGSLSNFAGGVLILILKPFKVGDYIKEDTKGNEGTVRKIDLFYTSLITSDNRSIIIPNGTLANSSLTNVTAFDKRRLELSITISAKSDVMKAKELINEVISTKETILPHEEIFVYVNTLGAGEVTLGAYAWVNTTDYWKTKIELYEQIKLVLDENEIILPMKQIEITMNTK